MNNKILAFIAGLYAAFSPLIWERFVVGDSWSMAETLSCAIGIIFFVAISAAYFSEGFSHE